MLRVDGLRFVGDPKDYPAVIAKGRQNLAEAFAYVERQLQGRDWAVPGGYTIADPYLLFYYRAAKIAGVPMEQRFPLWTALSKRVMARPAVQRVLKREAEALAGEDPPAIRPARRWSRRHRRRGSGR